MGVLEAKEVTYHYTEGKPVLNQVSLSFEKGKLYVILGPSGCGKTTLLSLLGGLDVPDGGEILFEGKELKEIGLERYRHEHVSFVFQNYNLIDYMTPEENVALTTREDPLPTLLSLGLTQEEVRRNVLKLSGGQQQRVAIARSLIYQPAILLADEPTGNLDRRNSEETIELLKLSNQRYGQTVLLITHDEKTALMAERILTLEDGKIVRDEVMS